MTTHQTADALKYVLADTYALYIKTQNYHWNVTGPHFKSLHELFETQYKALAEAPDEIAERIRTLGERVQASFNTYAQFSTIEDGDANADAKSMLQDLYSSHRQIINTIKKALVIATKEDDNASHDLLIARLAYHEKNIWILKATMEP